MQTISVFGFVQGFSDQAPLHRGVSIVVHGKAFVGGPTKGTMVDDDVLLSLAGQAVKGNRVARSRVQIGQVVAWTETQVTDNDIGSVYPHLGTGDADTVARG